MPTRFVDAFGQQLWDIHHHGYPHTVVERSDGFIGIGAGGLRRRCRSTGGSDADPPPATSHGSPR